MQQGWVQNEDRRPKTQKRKPLQNRLEITLKWFERDCRPKQKRETARFAFINKFDEGLRFVHNPVPNVQNEDSLKIVLKSFQNGSNVIVDRSRNEKQQDLRLSTNLTRVFVLYITLPNVQNEDSLKIVLKSLQNGSNVIVDRSRNEKQQDLRLSTNLTRVFVLSITLPNVQNEDSLKIVLKSLQNGSNVIVDRSRNEKQQDLRLSTNLTRVFVLSITLPNVQNEDSLKIVLKSLQNGSNVIVDRSRNEKQQDLRLSTNLTRVFVLYITLPNVKNEDPFKIVLKSLQNGSNVI